jgi:hypothetical protein
MPSSESGSTKSAMPEFRCHRTGIRAVAGCAQRLPAARLLNALETLDASCYGQASCLCQVTI